MKLVTPMDLNANGHYTPGVLAGGMLYISGQFPINPETGQIVTGDAGEQCQQALFNMDKVL
ncbi:MAG: RidA family protein, partial [Selenomonas sp.]|nr:RidA family protein [Selenomonas sp.]